MRGGGQRVGTEAKGRGVLTFVLSTMPLRAVPAGMVAGAAIPELGRGVRHVEHAVRGRAAGAVDGLEDAHCREWRGRRGGGRGGGGGVRDK
jgi:hypothetical protein